MEQERPSYLHQLSQEDWEKTPASVKKLVEDMGQRIDKLETHVTELQTVHQQQKREN